MRAISLTRGVEALVDDEDYDRVVSFAKWSAKPILRGSGGFYAFCTRGKTTIYMHRFILNAGAFRTVDHANGNGVDNRKANIRLATLSQNSANRDIPATQSKFRGVYPNSGGFRARIWAQRACQELGNFRSPVDAARAYDNAARTFYGPFARLNFAAEQSNG